MYLFSKVVGEYTKIEKLNSLINRYLTLFPSYRICARARAREMREKIHTRTYT